MSYAFRIPDETYRTLRLIAERQGRTPEQLFEAGARAQSVCLERLPATTTGISQSTRFIGACEADEPDLVHRHDHYVTEAAADPHDRES